MLSIADDVKLHPRIGESDAYVSVLK